MRTWPFLALAAVLGCSSALTQPRPGEPSEVRLIRLFDGAGQERTQHILLFHSEDVNLEARMYAAEGFQITGVSGGVAVTYTFTPDTLATSRVIAAEPLKGAVRAVAPPGTIGSLYATLRFLRDSSTRTFGPFECLVHD